LERAEVYFQFKPYYNKTPDEVGHLVDIIDFTGPSPLKERIEKIVIFPEGLKNQKVVSAIQVINLIKQSVGNVIIHHIGESSVLYEPQKAAKENPILVFLRVAISSLFLFFGSALAIMYFHSDVNMNQAHEMIYYLISGEKNTNPALFSISYTIGVGVGIAVFFEVVNKVRDKNNAGPLELELYQSQKELADYQKDQEGNQKID